MVIALDPARQAALDERAQHEGVTPEVLAVRVLREQFLKPAPFEPRDEWERLMLSIASDCGVSLSNEAVSSEGTYE